VARLPQHRASHLTRSGSLAYYLAAWVCGTLFFVAASSLTKLPLAPSLSSPSRGFFLQYFFDLATGWLAVLLLAFALRRLARTFHWSRALPWVLSGAVLTVLIGLTLAILPTCSLTFAEWMQFLKEAFELGGENGIALRGHRPLAAAAMVLAGMATAYVLFRIERAFEPHPEASMEPKE
jgi:hypothetical protein